MPDYEHIINVYKRAYNRTLASGDIRTEAYGRRLTQWIQTAEQDSDLFTDRGSAFSNGKTSLGSNVLVLS
jgi:hypothetical protein